MLKAVKYVYVYIIAVLWFLKDFMVLKQNICSGLDPVSGRVLESSMSESKTESLHARIRVQDRDHEMNLMTRDRSRDQDHTRELQH